MLLGGHGELLSYSLEEQLRYLLSMWLPKSLRAVIPISHFNL